MYDDDSKLFREVNFVYEAESSQNDLDSLYKTGKASGSSGLT